MPETNGENIWEEELGAWDKSGDCFDSVPRFQRSTTRRLKLLERNESEIVKKLRSEVAKREQVVSRLERTIEALVERVSTMEQHDRKYETNVIAALEKAKDEANIALVIDLMKLNMSSAKVQVKGCSILGTLAYDGGKCTHQEAIASSGGIEVVVRAMELFEDNENVQYWGCFALAELAQNNAKNKATILRLKGRDRVDAAEERARVRRPERGRVLVVVDRAVVVDDFPND